MDQAELLKDINAHIAALKTKRSAMDRLWPVIAKLLFSVNKDLTTGGTAQLSINNELYDGSGMQALKVWAAGVVGNTCGRDQDWQHLRYRNNRANTLPGVAFFQKDLEDLFYSMLDQSNFYEWAYNFAQTAGWVGTAAAFMDTNELERSVIFHELRPGCYWIDEDKTGSVNVLYHEYEMQAWEILEAYPDLPLKYRAELEKNQYANHTISQIVRPRKQFDPEDGGNRNFAFQSVVMADGNKIILEESGYKSFPFIVYRVTKQHGSPWGGGPGLDMIRDGQINQAVAETMLLADQKLVSPALIASDSMRDEGFVTHPDGINWVPDALIGKIGPINQGINRPVGMDREQMLRQAIESHFSTPVFMMQSRSDKVKTKAEFLGQQAEQNAILTPIFGGWSSQVLDAIFPMLQARAQEFRIFPQVPEALAEMDLGPMDVVYVGNAATIRKRYHALSGVESYAQTARMLKEAFPEKAQEINDGTDIDQLNDLALEGNNVEIAKRSQADRDKDREMRRKAMVMQAQAATQMQAMAATAGGPQ